MNSTIFYHLSPYFFFFFLMIPRPPRSTLFPYTSSSDLWKDPWKRQKIETLALLLRGALEAEAKVGLKMNIAQKDLAKLLESLPALRNPTISSLSQSGWVAVETIIDEHIVRELIPRLKAAGAEGIIEYPLNKVVY